MSEYHFVLSIVNRRATVHFAFVGTITPAPGETRETVYQFLLHKLSDASGVPTGDCLPTFFSLEPNHLPNLASPDPAALVTGSARTR